MKKTDIQKQLQFLKAVVDNLPGSIYWKDKDGVYVGNNEYAKGIMQSLNKISDKDIVGFTDADLFGQEVAERFRKNDLEVMRTGETSTNEEVAVARDGRKITQVSVKKPLYDEDGEVIGVVGNTFDITKEKEIQEELQQAKEQLETALAAKNLFIANMSHDIRTPLSGICALAETVAYHTADPDHKKDAELLLQSSTELLCFFERILDVVSLDKGEDYFENTVFNLKEMVNSTVAIVRPNAEQKGLQLTVQIDQKTPFEVRGNETYLRRILLNLITNAVKYTEYGKIDVAVANKNISGTSVTIELSVSDTGMGIPVPAQKTIFDKFTRLQPAYVGVYRGVGVGLYLVKQMLHRIGGEITLESDIGEGSTFRCYIPLEIMREVDSQSDIGDSLSSEIQYSQSLLGPKQTSSEPDNVVRLNERHVLLVEDNVIAQHSEKSKLLELGCSVEIADTGQAALRLVKQRHYDLVLLDVGLPDVNGVDLAEQLRDYLTQDEPIILLTAHLVENDEIRNNPNISAVYHKPLMWDKAKELVERYGK